MMKYEVLNQKILELQDEIIAAIQQNMRIDSVKGEAKSEAPYGEGPKRHGSRRKNDRDRKRQRIAKSACLGGTCPRRAIF